MKKILFIFTGGTIGSTIQGDYICTDIKKTFALIEGYKKRHSFDFDYQTEVPYFVLSENINGNHIKKLIETVKNNLDKGYDGIVVTHGTDTLAYSSAALSYALGKCETPVLLVSANFPLDDVRSNGFENLKGALDFIDKVKEKGVWVSYKNERENIKIHRGSRLLPHICFSDRVESVKNEIFGYFDGNNFVKNENYKELFDEISPFCLFEENLFIKEKCESILRITPYPGMVYPEIAKNIKYVLLESYHSGTIDTFSKRSKGFFERAKRKNVLIFLSGTGEEISYESTRLYDDFGIIPLPCISPVAAYMKLWMLDSASLDCKRLSLVPLGGDIV